MDAELERNGNEYVTIEESGGGQLGSHVKEEDVRHFFEGFKVDKVRVQLTTPSVSLPTNSHVLHVSSPYRFSAITLDGT